MNTYLIIYTSESEDTEIQYLCFKTPLCKSYADAEVCMEMYFRKMNQVQELEFEPSEPKFKFQIHQINKLI